MASEEGLTESAEKQRARFTFRNEMGKLE